MIKIGCCGFGVSRMKYLQHFKVVEIQKTFYKLPRGELVEKWGREVPPKFEFTMKVWQLITHTPKSPTYRKAKIKIEEGKEKNYGSFKPTDEVFRAWEDTEEIGKILGVKIFVFQSPPSFKWTDENRKNLTDFFNTIDRKNYIFVWESRGNWGEKVLKEICDDLNLIDGVDPFKRVPISNDLIYYRLHGKGGYKYKYTDDELNEMSNGLARTRNAYIMFNNIYMFEDALRFKEILRGGENVF